MKTKISKILNSNQNLLRFTFLKLIGEGIIFLFPILIAKFLQPDIYGSYSLGMMVIFFATTLFLSSSSTPFIISANREHNSKKSISESFTTQILFFLISLLFIGVLFLIFSKFIIDFIYITPLLLFYLYLAFIGISIKTIISNYFLGVNKKNFHAKIGILYGIFLILFLFIFELNLANLFLNYFYASLIISVIGFWKMNKKKVFPLKYSKENFMEQWDFTKWQMFGLTAAYFINWGDSIIINYFLSVFEVGVYNLAYQVFKGLFTFMYIINTFYLPIITKKIDNKEYISHYLYKVRYGLFLIGCIGIIFLILISPILFKFFDESYSNSILVLQILLVGVIFKFWSIFYTPIFNVKKKYKFSQTMNIAQILFNVLLGVILVFPWGIYGVAVATTVSYIVRALIDEIFFRSKVKSEVL